MVRGDLSLSATPGGWLLAATGKEIAQFRPLRHYVIAEDDSPQKSA